VVRLTQPITECHDFPERAPRKHAQRRTSTARALDLAARLQPSEQIGASTDKPTFIVWTVLVP
jgi:hypothetical protein